MNAYELLEIIKNNRQILKSKEKELLSKRNNLLNLAQEKDYDSIINSLTNDFDVLAHTERIKDIVKNSLTEKSNRIALNLLLNSDAFFLFMGIMNIVNPMGDFAVIFICLGIVLLMGEALINNHLLYKKEYKNMQEVLASKDIEEVTRDLDKARKEKQKLDQAITINNNELNKTKSQIELLEGTYNMVLKILEEVPLEELNKESLNQEKIQSRKRTLNK